MPKVRWRVDPLGRHLSTIAGTNCMVRPDIVRPGAGQWVAIVHFDPRPARRRWHTEELAKSWCEVTAQAGTPPPD
jgi:hypothetical protein